MDTLFVPVSDDLPLMLDITLEEVEEYWDEWLLWNSTEKPTFTEASNLPDRMIRVFMTLDNMYSKMTRQKEKKEKGVV